MTRKAVYAAVSFADASSANAKFCCTRSLPSIPFVSARLSRNFAIDCPRGVAVYTLARPAAVLLHFRSLRSASERPITSL
jgi:hypothetical protein